MRAKKKIGRGCGNCLLKKIIAFILSLEGFPILFLHYASPLYKQQHFIVKRVFILKLHAFILWYFIYVECIRIFCETKKNQDSWAALINFTQLCWVNDSMRRVNQLCILLWMSIHHLQFNYFTIWEWVKDWVKVSKGLKFKLYKLKNMRMTSSRRNV